MSKCAERMQCPDFVKALREDAADAPKECLRGLRPATQRLLSAGVPGCMLADGASGGSWVRRGEKSK